MEKRDTELRDTDIRVDVWSQSIRGGESRYRLTHIPTGIVVEFDGGRSPWVGKKAALEELRRMVDSEATVCPLVRRMCAISSVTLDFPLVPVTAMTVIFLEGKPYFTAPIKASE